ncbi:MAG: amidase [Gammaproteobacteria bacterium]|nr:amidase [Gammaproteobacteria bacterium]
MMELTELTITKAAEMIERREISPVELAEAHLARIARVDPQLNCFITLTVQGALDEARLAEAAIGEGNYLGPLHGIPLAVKDLYETAGVPTTAGSTFFAEYVPEEDCAAVLKLKAAGAINLGKLNMHEIALGVTNKNPHYGACRNPWQLERTPGGSSGGSGAALAAGLCLGSLGTDTGGSIRIPASLSGVVGFKPTYGRVSTRGVIPLSWNLDHAGPMARRVRDVALLLQAIAGYDTEDPYSVDVPVGDFVGGLAEGVRGWRVAIASDAFFRRAEEEVLAAVNEAAKVLAASGAQVSEVEISDGRAAALANGLMTTSDAAAFHQERLETQPEGFGEDVLQRLQTGAGFSSTEYILARRTQTILRYQFERFFRDYDVLLTPSTPIPAPLLDGPDAVEQARKLTRFTAPFNLTGLPALSLPCGFTRGGLPVGLQIVGPAWAEARVLRAGYAYERATDWHLRSPAL